MTLSKSEQKKEIKNINLFTIKFPITALLSITHRISGVFLFLCLPIYIFFLYSINHNIKIYKDFIQIMTNSFSQLILIVLLLCIIIHLLAGIRHLIMDFFSIGEEIATAKKTALITFIASIILAIVVYIYI